jgi:ribosomal protein S18 acetylase RimI-like enzyme
MGTIRIVDVTDVAAFERIPPCADPGFDHRSCDFWEDADRGSKAARASWLKTSSGTPTAAPAAGAGGARKPGSSNPFLADLEARSPSVNPFATDRPANPFLTPGDDDDEATANPFAPQPAARPAVAADAPRKLQLLGRGLGVAGSYAKVLLDDDVAKAYAQFGPLTAYPRAQRTRELYPALPDAPLPAVITCIATTAQARGEGLARRLIEAVCDDLAARGFTAVEAYPEVGAEADATSAATPEFWESLEFRRAVADERFPVMRRDLA